MVNPFGIPARTLHTMPMNDSIRVRVPATSANLGPGFDSLGIALRVYNTVTVRRAAAVAPDAMPFTRAGER